MIDVMFVSLIKATTFWEDGSSLGHRSEEETDQVTCHESPGPTTFWHGTWMKETTSLWYLSYQPHHEKRWHCVNGWHFCVTFISTTAESKLSDSTASSLLKDIWTLQMSSARSYSPSMKNIRLQCIRLLCCSDCQLSVVPSCFWRVLISRSLANVRIC